MKRSLFAFSLAVGLLLAPTMTAFERWPLAQVLPTIAKMTWVDSQGNCTATSINQRKGHYITASHCLTDEGMLVDGKAAVLVEADVVNEIAVIKGEAKRPRIPLGNEPVLGDDIAGLGFGYNAPSPLMRVGVVFNLSMSPPDGGTGLLFSSLNHLDGMSGGPVIDRSGHLVSVVVCSVGEVACSAPYGAVAKLVKKHR